MKNADLYFKNTKDAIPHNEVKKFIENNNKTGVAIDLGCGAGRDTIFLLKNGWNVTAIDVETTENYIKNSLSKEEITRLTFINENFSKAEFPKSDLVIAYNSLPFVKKENFTKIWDKVENCINSGGFFIGTFWGVNDSWNTPQDFRRFMTKDEVINLFEKFDIVKLEESEKDGISANKKPKHWHTFEIVAKRN